MPNSPKRDRLALMLCGALLLLIACGSVSGLTQTPISLSTGTAHEATADPGAVEPIVQPGGTPITFDLPAVTAPPDFAATGELHWPLPEPGVLKQIYWTMHPGIDVGIAEGTPVLAADNGVVVFADKAEVYGNLVILDHGNGTQTWYGHLADFKVELKEPIRQGSPIGSVGSTGSSTGVHLHFEVRVNGKPLPPLSHLTNVPHSILESNTILERGTATAIAGMTQTAIALFAGQTATARWNAELTRIAEEQTRAALERTATPKPSRTPAPSPSPTATRTATSSTPSATSTATPGASETLATLSPSPEVTTSVTSPAVTPTTAPAPTSRAESPTAQTTQTATATTPTLDATPSETPTPDPTPSS
ncbi:MAG: M23 family metallopeptidase [Chloroflexi bacterium]|nr:M23 family metallopeptidase [Chloroflexota bacterium]